MPTSVASDAPTRDRVRRWTVSGRRSPTDLAHLGSEADRYRLENAVQLRHLTASIVVLAATAGADSNAARSGRSTAPRVEPAKLTTMARSDGAPQVLYNGHPLYRYTGDEKPGDTNGQRVTAFGAAWFAVSGVGQVISRPASKPAGGGID
jgi:Secreted repeat of unknown function